MKTGYYSPDLSFKGVHVGRWNGIAVKYGNGNPDHPANFTKEAFIAAAIAYLEDCLLLGSKSFIELPINQVYGDNDLSPSEWIDDIVIMLKDHPALEGWYLADEPEIRGYDGVDGSGNRVNSDHPLEHEWLLDRYRTCKRLAPDVPVLVVFAEITLYDQKYRNKAPFYDIFGFDYYPFTTHKGHIKLWHRYKQWAERAGDFPVMYVGQGCGDSAGFGQYDITAQEFDEQFIRAKDALGDQLKYYTLWDWSYASHKMRILGVQHLLRVASGDLIPIPEPEPEPEPKPKRSIFARILNYLKQLFQ